MTNKTESQKTEYATEEEMDKIIKYLLEKNKELYKRLAK